MGHKKKKRPTRPHCKVVPKEIAPNKPKGSQPEFDVRIRISKRPNTDHFTGDIQAKNTNALIEALAVMLQRTAALLGAPTEQVYAVVATLLFQETSSVSPDGADTFPKGAGSEGTED